MLARLVRTRLVGPTRLYSTEIAKQPATGIAQAPNRDKPWSTSQRPRPGPESNARFEQVDMSLQPTPLSAQELIQQEPIRLVHGRRAVCDGGGGPLGHPKIFINLVRQTRSTTMRVFTVEFASSRLLTTATSIRNRVD
ncbi:unnamed protein product [Rhizoctonia solani]|uniref:Zinc finger CHCC-type domain-containing protein n=1 Tax=Rhizoctonia solani TaxID=456999 RepID=A0A8H3BPC2_9AGAM|nr:unnamed protein product [Rhizoctonia solani]